MSLDPDDVREDSRYAPGEKETIIRFNKEKNDVFVWTAEAGIMRRLIQHPEFEVDEKKSIEREDSIVAVYGTIPIGCLLFKSSPRAKSGHANVVSDDVF